MVFSGTTKEISDMHCVIKKSTHEDGFVLIAAVLMLLVLSFMAAAMSNTTIFEVMTAGNEKISQEQFFKADAGVNTILAQNQVPLDSFLPASAPAPGPFVNCNTPQGQLPFANFDLDGDATNDVAIYLLSKFSVSGGPPEIQIASCAVSGDTTGAIIAGVQYGTNPGGQESVGDINEYQN